MKTSLEQALHCPNGGYTYMRHNELRDSFANLLSEVGHDVEIKTLFSATARGTFALKSTTDDDARLDIKAGGLWEPSFNKKHFDVNIFNSSKKAVTKRTRITNR